jgi:hypothetical protein
VVIGDFNVINTVGGPAETEAILVVDPDGVVAGAIMGEGMQFVAGRNFEVVEGGGGIKVTEFAAGGRKNVAGQGFRGMPFENAPRGVIRKDNVRKGACCSNAKIQYLLQIHRRSC